MYFLDFNENVVFWPKWWIFWHKTWLWGICTSYACGQRHLVTVPMRYGSIRYDSYEKCTNFGSILIISVDHYYGDFGHVSPPHTAIFGRFRGIKYLDQHVGGYIGRFGSVQWLYVFLWHLEPQETPYKVFWRYVFDFLGQSPSHFGDIVDSSFKKGQFWVKNGQLKAENGQKWQKCPF